MAGAPERAIWLIRVVRPALNLIREHIDIHRLDLIDVGVSAAFEPTAR
jgi:hypothetical protein